MRAHDVAIFNLQRAVELVPGEVHTLRFAGGAQLQARSWILATGARWRELGVPGEQEYRNKGVAYWPAL